MLTADFLCGMWPVQHSRKVDWIGVAALIAGMTTRFYAPDWIGGTESDWWWHSWLLPSWGMGFLVCLLGRLGQRYMKSLGSVVEGSGTA